LRRKIRNYDPVPTPSYHQAEVVAQVEVVSQAEVVVQVEVKMQVVGEAASELEVMDHPIVPRLDHTGPMTTTTVGPMVMIVQRTMTADHVIIKHLVIKYQQQVGLQWEVPSKIKNSPSGRIDGVGSNKQIILKRKRLTQQQKQ
jgi:hypothetical protein